MILKQNFLVTILIDLITIFGLSGFANAGQLVYSTYLGESRIYALAVDSNGNAYITGEANYPDFPVTPGAYDTTYNGGGSVFVTKLNASGSALVYSTFLGSMSANCMGLAIDNIGNVYITGLTWSNDFPTTSGAFDTTYNGNGDLVVCKLNTTGSALIYSTYLGGKSSEGYYNVDIVADNSGNAYVTGETYSTDFPTTPGAFDTTLNGQCDIFVSKLNPNGSTLLYSTFIGGSNDDIGSGIALDKDGYIYITGYTCSSATFPTTSGAFDTSPNGGMDVVVCKFNPTLSSLIYSTFLGGSGYDCGPNGTVSIAVNDFGNAYIAGWTESFDFPTTPYVYQRTFGGEGSAFVTKLNSAGSGLVYSTYIGGEAYNKEGDNMALDVAGNVYITGYTDSTAFPITSNAYTTTFQGGPYDVFISKLNSTGTELLYSTYFGGNQLEYSTGIAVDNDGTAYISGYTESSTDFPITTNAFDTIFHGRYNNGFVSKLALVDSSPVASFYGTPTTGKTPLFVQFYDTSTGGIPKSWYWTFGDGSTSTKQHPGHIYKTCGEYTVSLTVGNTYGISTAIKNNYVSIPTAVDQPFWLGYDRYK
ncbi:MAG: SBBP repeat-containing protein [bacterium]